MGTRFTETELASFRQRHGMFMYAQLKIIFWLGAGAKPKPGKTPVGKIPLIVTLSLNRME